MPARDPLARYTGGAYIAGTSQARPLNRPGQVRNDAGGYVFEKTTWDALMDFLVMGASGGTYHCGQRKMVLRNLDVVTKALGEDGVRAVREATTIANSMPVRAPKPNPQLYVIAAAFSQGDLEAKQLAKQLFSATVRTTDQLSMVIGYYKQLRGGKLRFGRCFKTALQSWFLDPPVAAVAWRVLKARQRKTPQGERLTVRDVLRLARPKTTDPARAALFEWICRGDTEGGVEDDGVD